MLFILEDNEDRIEHFERLTHDIPHHLERTVPDAVAWLEEHSDRVTLYSLDNDLYVPDYEGEEGEGWELCEWLLEHARPAPVIVHSTNTLASTRMEMACDEAGWEFHRVVPYLGMRWIEERWIGVVRELLAGGDDPAHS